MENLNKDFGQKKCSKCKLFKSIDDYCNDKNRRDGKYPQCSNCRTLSRVKNKDNIRKNQRNWIEKNIEEEKQKRKKYYQKNKEKISNKNKIWNENNKEKIKELHKEWYSKNKNYVLNLKKEFTREQAIKKLISQVKTRAKKLKVDFDLDFEYFSWISQQLCTYCKTEPSNYFNKNLTYQGIDRINSDLGYTKNNTCPCCTKCNFAKNCMSVDEFKIHIIAIYNNFILGENLK